MDFSSPVLEVFLFTISLLFAFLTFMKMYIAVVNDIRISSFDPIEKASFYKCLN